MHMLGVYINSTDPTFNLALEDHLFNSLKPSDAGYFLLWHNEPSIIVGRHQNTLQEINTELVKSYDLPVVRRMTGGGAVYHDLGNVNFSFVRPLKDDEENRIDFKKFLQPILETLQGFSVNADFSSRNDLVCAQRKFSGSAQLRRADRGCRRVLHHGTLLVNLDLAMLAAVLTGAPDKYLSKGISSIASRVANLQEFLPHDVGMQELKQALMQNCATEVIELDAEIFNAAKQLSKQKYATHAWNYGASPPFTEKRRERFSWGLVECYIDVQVGIIKGIKIFGDFFAKSPIEEFEQLFNGIAYTAQDVANTLKNVHFDDYFSGCEEQAMYDFFCKF